MKTRIGNSQILLIPAIASILLVACSTQMQKPAGADSVRSKLTQLQSDPQLAGRAPVAIKDAEIAVRAAEEPRRDTDLAQHLVFMADRKVDIASAQAQTNFAEEQRKGLSEQRERARLDSRTREADRAHVEAAAARMETSAARMETETARAQTDDLQRQISDLNAKNTERGLLVTLGDVLFDTNKSTLKSGTPPHLGKLAGFLNQYPDRTVIIEGYTDSTGSEDYNTGLSQRRADTVRSYLLSQGIAANRIVATGQGEGAPVAANDSASGRQQNRRVEVIISNTASSSR